MQICFYNRLIFESQLPTPTPTFSTMSKLFPPSTATTPLRRNIQFPFAVTAVPPNCPAVDDADASHILLFSSQPAESKDPLLLLTTQGALPADFPLGTYYLVGSGMIVDSHGSTLSPLDGHGYLRAFRFGCQGAVTYSARYVETEALGEERDEETGEWRFRRPGLFSIFKSHWTSPFSNIRKNVANTTVLSWGKRLFCLWEGGHPYELDPTSLATIGPINLTKMPAGQHREDVNLVVPITKTLLHG